MGQVRRAATPARWLWGLRGLALLAVLVGAPSLPLPEADRPVGAWGGPEEEPPARLPAAVTAPTMPTELPIPAGRPVVWTAGRPRAAPPRRPALSEPLQAPLLPLTARALPEPPEPALSRVQDGWARVPILMYHYIREAPDHRDRIGVGLSVTPEVFAAQMDYLQRAGYRPVTLGHLWQALRGEASLPPRPIVLTFDDGYADFYTEAWPVLRRLGFASTVFVITGLVGRPGYLTREMIVELDRSGSVEFGSHTVTHPDLTMVAPDRLRAELIGSRRALEGWLGHPVELFCYPSGRYHAGVREAVAAAGYAVAVTTRPGRDHHRDGALEWQRVRVSGPGSVAVLAEALAG